jgi:hypothetical protein
MQEHGSADAPDTGRECREGSTENHPFLHKIVKNQRFSEMITRGVEGTFEMLGIFDPERLEYLPTVAFIRSSIWLG